MEKYIVVVQSFQLFRFFHFLVLATKKKKRKTKKKTEKKLKTAKKLKKLKKNEKTEKTIFFHRIYLPAKYGFLFLMAKTKTTEKKLKNLYFSIEYIYLPNTGFPVYFPLFWFWPLKN